MFKKRICLLVFLLFLSVSGITRLFRSEDIADREAYQRLMMVSTNENKKIICKAKQQRYNVTKHFLFTKGSDRLQMKLNSISSELELDQQEGKTELVEHFKDVHCIMQESFQVQPDNSLNQVIRQLDAHRATYHYKTEELFAEKAKLARFIAFGDQLDPIPKFIKPIMNGVATQVELSLTNHDMPLKAKGLQATFHDWRKE
ncbi:MAG: hypothetical protein H0W88_09980 [Parachlamydiaceae bacterium]|nr:hypothetical protein [Parachlamydiaceae bacterium]